MQSTLHTNQGHASAPRARLTIGMLFENMPNEQQDYLAEVLAGANSTAQERDVNLLCFAGGHLYHTFYNEFDTQRNILYELVTDHVVNGLVILGTISTYAPMHKTMEFYQRYRSLPVINIGLPLANVPTVMADAEVGLYAAMVHLIRDHHYRRIAFINGPETRSMAGPRHQVYVQALTDYGIAIDPALVIPGDWTVHSGGEAIKLLIDHQKADVQAIVASNDNMALGALAALQARGIHVPYDMALVGFDDAKMAQLTMPSLTTVRQPMFALGAQAITALLAQIAGEKVPLKMPLPTELIIRQSCGCPDPMVAKTACLSLPAAQSAEQVSIIPRAQIVAELSPLLDMTADATGWLEDLLGTFVSDVEDESVGAFMSTLDKILRQVIQSGADITRWQDIISMTRRLSSCFGDAARCARAENLWHQARVFIGETARKELAQRQLQMDQKNILLRLFGEALVTTFDVDTLLHIVAERMPQLGIPSCYLALYENPQPYEYPQPAPEWAQWVLAYREHDAQSLIGPDKLEAGVSASRFPSWQLLPPGMMPQDQRYTMVVEPLYFQRDQIGFALLEMGPREGSFYETLREQISSALKGALLFHEQKRTEAALEKAYAEVEKQVQERTVELEQEIVERKQAEKMQETLIAELEAKNTELERFTYTVSHDLKSPLITIGGFVGFLEKDALAGDVERVQADMVHINDAVGKMQQLLGELLELSRIGRRMNPPEVLAFDEIAREAVTVVRGRIEARGVVVEIAPGLPSVYGDRARLVEVVQNLVDNACKFMGDQPRPWIEIGMRQTGEGPAFYVRDNGVGIAAQYHDKVFDLFEKLDPQSEGTGVGLAIVKRVIETHGGKIWIESVGAASGATFYFTLPVLDGQAADQGRR
jgi:DNA-binding LacI/PurR family transcriptional regulator/signal transduction histidine kinase